MSVPQKWLAAIPMVYREGAGFWDRDTGVLCLGLRTIGVNATFVALGPGGIRKDVPLVLGGLTDFECADWWKQWQAQGTILNSWGAPRYERVAKAIKQSGMKLVIRLDSDGFKSPRTHFFRYLLNLYVMARDQNRNSPVIYALSRAICFRIFPSLYDEPTARHLSYADRVLIESPLAKEIISRYFRLIKRPELVEKLRVVSHVIKDGFRYDPAIEKAPSVICVARWNAYAKDAPLLMQVLERTLPSNPDYVTRIIGPPSKRMAKWHSNLPKNVQDQINVLGGMPNDELRSHYQRARIILFTSKSEGFPVAGAEALAYGCSVVGPSTLPGLNYMASESSGTLAISRRTGDMCDALGAELQMWRQGARDPVRISQAWIPRVAASSVAAQIIGMFPESAPL
jgi:hypothetical protein